MNVQAIRKDFPILARQVRGKPLVYLDNAATTQKPWCVIDALTRYYERSNANVHRAVHALSEEATAAYEEARLKVKEFVNAEAPECIVFVRNTTEAINLVAHAWGRKYVGPGDEILLTEMEHHSNLVPWQLLAQAKGAHLKFIPITPDYTLDMERLDVLLTGRTKIVSVTHMSNVLGTINPVVEIARAAHQAGARVLVDGAQAAPHMPVDVQALGCDFYAFSGHKMLGPTGIGVLYGKRDLLEAMDTFLGGGDMIRQVWPDHSTWNDVPAKFEAGTPNIADAIGLGAAIDYLRGLGMERVREHEVALTQYALDALFALEAVTVYGPSVVRIRGGAVSFNYQDIHPHDLGTVLDREGVAIRAGHHCAQPLMRRLNVAATARASFYIYNTAQEVDILIEALKKAGAYLGFQER
ncbi:MAG: cysteine desulfurase [Chloroflexi bacterium]|nr:cysteine desulfurase [Chloroflexota bacterium]